MLRIIAAIEFKKTDSDIDGDIPNCGARRALVAESLNSLILRLFDKIQRLVDWLAESLLLDDHNADSQRHARRIQQAVL